MSPLQNGRGIKKITIYYNLPPYKTLRTYQIISWIFKTFYIYFITFCYNFITFLGKIYIKYWDNIAHILICFMFDKWFDMWYKLPGLRAPLKKVLHSPLSSIFLHHFPKKILSVRFIISISGQKGGIYDTINICLVKILNGIKM